MAEGGGNDARPGTSRADGALASTTPAVDSAKPRRATRFRILSPLDGDRYAIPAGVETRYATISLRAAGLGAESVQWSVDGKPFAGGRWALTPGRHVIRAVSARGETLEARILVER
jgi:hypothetical protein